MHATVRTGDTLARLAGDEFVLLVEQLPAALDEARRVVEAVAKRLHTALDTPIVTEHAPTAVTSSVGVTIASPTTTASAADLVHAADVAMYESKTQGGAVTTIHVRPG